MSGRELDFFGGLSGNPKFRKVVVGAEAYANADEFAQQFGAAIALFRQMLKELDELAAVVGRLSIHVATLGARFALAGEHGSPRCAFCHAAIVTHEPGLVACKLCSTVLRVECWSDLGRCPVLGCRGQEPDRAPAK